MSAAHKYACTQTDRESFTGHDKHFDFLETGEMPQGGLSDDQFDAVVRAVWGTRVRVDVIMKLLGLWNARNTLVGSNLVRCVSGGPKPLSLYTRVPSCSAIASCQVVSPVLDVGGHSARGIQVDANLACAQQLCAHDIPS